MMFQQQIESLRQQFTENMMSNVQRIDQVLDSLRTQLNQQLSTVAQQLQNATGQIGERIDSASKVMGEVQKGLGAVYEANKRILDITKEIAELEDLLKPAKIRGGVGEVLLENLLDEIIPGKYTRQYRFRSGEQVDFVIQIRDRLVPVDSKFPLESFRRLLEAKTEDEKTKCRKEFRKSVKNHIDKIAAKYIKPDEDTLNFAMMYIPAENIYYETVIKEDKEESIFEYSLEKKVIPVSPNTFFAYLMTILLGFRGMEIEKNALMVMDSLGKLQVELGLFMKEFEILGGHIMNANKKYDDVLKRITRFSDKITGIVNQGKLPSGE